MCRELLLVVMVSDPGCVLRMRRVRGSDHLPGHVGLVRDGSKLLLLLLLVRMMLVLACVVLRVVRRLSSRSGE